MSNVRNWKASNINNMNNLRNYKHLNKGSYGSVYTATNGNKQYIVKVQKYGDKSEKEASILYELRRKRYVPKYVFDQVLYNNHYIVMDYKPDFVTISEYFKVTNKSAKTIAKIMLNCLKALKKFHSIGYAHLDIKPANILVNKKTFEVRLIDFGMVYGKEFDYNFTGGTISYMCPTRANMVKRENRTKTKVDPRNYNVDCALKIAQDSDIWAMGVVFFILYEHRFPKWFKQSNVRMRLANIMNTNEINVSGRKPNMVNGNNMNHVNLIFVIHGMVKKNPNDRISLNDAITILKRLTG